MINRVPSAGLQVRPYFHRYTDDTLDLYEVLASYDARAKMKLDELSKIMGLAGKPTGVDGSQVEGLVNEGRIAEVAAYCETDLLNTFRLWLLYEVFCGALSPEGLAQSETNLVESVKRHRASKPHLVDVL